MDEPAPGSRLTAPRPTTDHQALRLLAGDWRGEEIVRESRWFEAGHAIAHVSARVGVDGFAVIQDYRQVRAGVTTFEAHAVFTFDIEDRLYKMLWIDSLGFIPRSPASGTLKNNTLTLVRGSLRGIARHVFSFVDSDTYEYRVQFSPDAEGWEDVVSGTYRRVT